MDEFTEEYLPHQHAKNLAKRKRINLLATYLIKKDFDPYKLELYHEMTSEDFLSLLTKIHKKKLKTIIQNVS